jgi:hypothetical protein
MKPLDRSEIIRQSVSVFICGFAGLLPVIGLFPAVSAIIRGVRIRRAYCEPNPADHYRKWGIALGSLGILVNVCAIVIAIANRGYRLDVVF